MLQGLLLVSGLLLALATRPAPDSYQTAHSLLRALYPTLQNRGLTITISPDRSEPYDSAPRPLRAFVLTIAQPREGMAPSQLLTARFEFAVDDTLFIYLADGTYVNDLRRHRLAQWAGDHRGASTDEIAAILSEFGAKFGPAEASAMRTEALRQLHLIEPFVGRIQLQEIVFRGDDTPRWRAEFVASTAHGRRRYGVLFEPFDGRIVSIGGLGSE